MQLFTVTDSHFSPKDRMDAKTYLIADSEAQLFMYLADHQFNYHTDRSEGNPNDNANPDDDDYESYDGWYPDDWDIDAEQYTFIPYVSFIWQEKGNSEDESLFSDLYYGLTTHDWNPIGVPIDAEQYGTLIKLGIATDVRNYEYNK